MKMKKKRKAKSEKRKLRRGFGGRFSGDKNETFY